MWNRFDLFDCMVNQKPITVNGVRYQIMAMQLEDGSGYNFNLTVTEVGQYQSKQIFLRCRKVF